MHLGAAMPSSSSDDDGSESGSDGSDRGQYGPYVVKGLKDMEILSCSKWTEDLLEKEYEEAQYPDEYRFEFHLNVRNNMQGRYFYFLVEWLKKLCGHPQVWSIKVRLEYKQGEEAHWSDAAFECEGSRGLPDGYKTPTYLPGTYKKYYEIEIRWFCPGAVYGESVQSTLALNRIVEALRPMHTLRIDTFGSNPAIEIDSSFRSDAKTLKMDTRIVDLPPACFPLLEKISATIRSRYFQDSSPTNDSFFSKLGHFPLLRHLAFGASTLDNTVHISGSQAAFISSLRLSSLKLTSVRLANDVVHAFLSGLTHSNKLERLELQRVDLDIEGLELISRSLFNLASLRHLQIWLFPRPDSSNTEEWKTCMKDIENAAKTSLYLVGCELNVSHSTKVEIEHTLKMNRARRPVIEGMISVPPNLVARLLSNADKAYQATGIYALLREHSDLRKVVAWYANITSIPTFVKEAMEAGLISESKAQEMIEFNKRRRLK